MKKSESIDSKNGVLVPPLVGSQQEQCFLYEFHEACFPLNNLDIIRVKGQLFVSSCVERFVFWSNGKGSRSIVHE